MNDQPNIYQVAEAYVIAAAMNNYIKTFTTGYSGSRDATEYQAAMQFFTSVYKKYHLIAQTPVEYDALGYLTVKRDVRRGKYDMN